MTIFQIIAYFSIGVITGIVIVGYIVASSLREGNILEWNEIENWFKFSEKKKKKEVGRRYK